jgi:hypothetical protein
MTTAPTSAQTTTITTFKLSPRILEVLLQQRLSIKRGNSKNYTADLNRRGATARIGVPTGMAFAR